MKRECFLIFLYVGCVFTCNQRQEQYGIICVCNSSSCDSVPPIEDLGSDNLQMYFTSPSEPGFNTKLAAFSNIQDPGALIINIDPNDTHQIILGFGGAFTDATGLVIERLTDEGLQYFMESYFGESGIGYRVMNVPIGGTDFSERYYTLDDYVLDNNLLYFNLQFEDYVYKIPYILRAQELTNNQLKLIATPWTPPIWMKTPSSWSGGTILKEEYYQLWADYYIRFFEEYEKNSVNFWGLTTGNEPLTGFFASPTPSVGWTANQQAKWVAENLGPTLQRSKYKDLKVMTFDDGLLPMPFFVPYIMENDSAIQYIDGVATHTNWDFNMSPRIRNQASSEIKHVFRLSTKGSHYRTTPQLGDWERAHDYISNIIEVLRDYDYTGWIEYNLALDETGGPTFLDDKGDAPIIINTGTEFYKQPTFYAIGHFSKFIVPDSTRLGVQQSSDYVESVAFNRPDGLRVLLVHNFNSDQPALIQLQDSGRFSEPLTVSPSSINTIVYRS